MRKDRYAALHSFADAGNAEQRDFAAALRTASADICPTLSVEQLGIHSGKNEARSSSEESKSYWGPLYWEALHAAAASPMSLDALRAFYARLGDAVPCGECRAHFVPMLASMPVARADVYAWTVQVHNNVNRRLGKPVWGAQVQHKAAPHRRGAPFVLLAILLAIIAFAWLRARKTRALRAA